MPSSMTHSYFCIDVFNKLNDDSKKKVKNLEYLKVFAQGPDLLYFFNKFTKKGNEIRKLGGICHRHKTKQFFINLITYIKENNLQNNEQVISFLYGYITHFALDSTIHPYIYYKTGIFDKKKKETYKYNGLHGEMEYYLDVYMIFQNEKKESKIFKSYNYFKQIKTYDDKLEKMIDDVFDKTYNYKNVSEYLKKGVNGLITIFKYVRYDRFGIKKYFYKLLDFLSSDRTEKKQYMSYNVLHNQKIHYLNLEKKVWNHPVNIEETYDYSFIELYRIAIDKATKLIDAVTEILDSSKDKANELDYLFKDTSYITGKECENNKKLQYFEF